MRRRLLGLGIGLLGVGFGLLLPQVLRWLRPVPVMDLRERLREGLRQAGWDPDYAEVPNAYHVRPVETT